MASEELSWPVRRAARLAPHGDAVVDVADGRAVSYTELAERTAGIAGMLDRMGAAPGARVAILAANSLPHLELFLGVPAAGRVVVSLNTRLSAAELADQVRDAEPALLLHDAAHAEPAAQLGAPRVQLGPDYERLLEHGDPVTAPAADDLAAISYTGGTTGRAKGVMLTHRNLLANARHNLIATGHTREDRWLHVCPMFHVAGTANVVAATWVAARQVVLPRFDAAAVCAAIETHAVTHLVLVPTMVAMLLDHDAAHPADLRSLRHLQYAASPMSPTLQARLLNRLPDVDVAQFYGMTEAAPTLTTSTPADHRAGDERRRASVGAPVVGVEVEVHDLATREPVPAGEIGEVVARGDNVMAGYWRRPEETAAALVDGWYRTGDAGWLDEDGYLHLVDRLKDMIISGGENVYSVEVEAALLAHDAVAEAAVLGVPHGRWGEAVHAVVCLRDGHDATADALIEHCRGRIAGFKVPRSIDLSRDPLPRSGAGKTLKAQLRRKYQST